MKKTKPKKITRTNYGATYIGKLDISKNGMGYVTVIGRDIDIVIKRDNLRSAMSGDTVEVQLIESKKTKREEGTITKIVKHSQTELIGTVQLNTGFAFVIPDNEQFTKDVFIAERDSKPLKNGDRVLIRITDWSEKMKNPQGIVLEILTADKANDIAMKEILLQAGFSLQFPTEVIEESKHLVSDFEAECKKRKDLRNLYTITIDPYDAKDFDDAISFRILENKNYEIGVHIADVAHYVQPDTALDKEAFNRATSVYLPDRVLPMLPETISNELCSLRPHEDKLTFSVLFEINQKAEVISSWIGKTITHSNYRFTYEEVQDIIESGKGEHAKEILILHGISQKLRKNKFDQGAINFSSEEVKFILDENGIPIDVMVKQSKESHQLIEELMLMANRTVSEFASKFRKNKKPVLFPYRVHDSPDIKKLKSFAQFAARFGHKFDLSSPESIARSFNKMIIDSADDPEQEILHTLGIRTMAKAIYTTENIGHYGLGFEFYSHFTSPIRRYPDVLSHRILLGILENKPVHIENLEALCVHCSDKERKAMEAERDGNKYKQVEFMQKFIGDDFDAVISGVSAYGCWAQTLLHKCEGFVSLTNLSEIDDFEFSEEDYALVGRYTKMKFQIGQAIRVKIVSANLSKRQLDYDLILPDKKLNPSTPTKNKKRTTKR
ncbi:MAG: ribonuclease R [Bacteroidetes bacterium]|nr:ribonuclease R [Bacteroidota bacterium]